MTGKECGKSRAQGALDNFLGAMAEKLERENRSAEYVKAFWQELADNYGILPRS